MLGIEVKTASSGLTEEEEELVKLALTPANEPEAEPEEVSEQEESSQDEPEAEPQQDVEDDVQIIEVSRNHLQKELAHL